MCFPVQALPAPDNGQPDRHQEDVPQPIESVGEQGILQDPRLNLPHHGMEGYRPLILGVSIFISDYLM